MKHRKPGEAVELRYSRKGHTIALHPVTVMEDSPEQTVLALIPRTTVLEPEYHRAPDPGVNRAVAAVEVWASGPPRLVAGEWGATEVLQLFEPDSWFAIYHMWNASSGAFLCWYVNYQTPFSRTRKGFDTRDLALDLVVGSDLRYGLKDEHEFATYLEHGFIDPEEERSVWRAHEQILERIESREFPFDGSWLDRRPDQVAPLRDPKLLRAHRDEA